MPIPSKHTHWGRATWTPSQTVGCLQGKKRALSRNRHHGALTPDFLASRAMRNMFLLRKPPRLWWCAMAALADWESGREGWVLGSAWTHSSLAQTDPSWDTYFQAQILSLLSVLALRLNKFPFGLLASSFCQIASGRWDHGTSPRGRDQQRHAVLSPVSVYSFFSSLNKFFKCTKNIVNYNHRVIQQVSRTYLSYIIKTL